VWVVGRRAWSGVRFEGSVEELVEVLEFLQRKEDFRHVELVEFNESLNLSLGCRIVVLLALLDAEAL
jgi:hypothetical protein